MPVIVEGAVEPEVLRQKLDLSGLGDDPGHSAQAGLRVMLASKPVDFQRGHGWPRVPGDAAIGGRSVRL